MMRAPPRRGYDRAMLPAPRPWLDWAIAVGFTAAGVLMTLGEPYADDTIVDSIVVAAVTLPLAWRRTAPVAAAAALAAGTVISAIPTFAQVRCGVALPAALLIAFSVAARRDRGEALAGLALVLAGLVVLLFTDPLLDAGAVFILPLCAGVWWTGRLVRSRGRIAAELAERSRQLAETREASARLAVELDRAASAADLDGAARRPLRTMVALADAGVDEAPAQARTTFATIERQGRESLDELRQMLGRLRSDELDTVPQPTLADLAALADVTLTSSGDRRALPAGVELAGYRVVQHATEALHGPIDVALRYVPDGIEIDIRGRAAGGNATEAALAAARERVVAHGGRFARERGDDGACVLRTRLPAP
jgi:signal transduction histidine kinase